jgi:hypothetical protein
MSKDHNSLVPIVPRIAAAAKDQARAIFGKIPQSKEKFQFEESVLIKINEFISTT